MPKDTSNVFVGAGADSRSEQWKAMQEESIARYQDEHYEEDETIASLYGGFIAVSLKPGDTILDVGCGLFPDLPAYARGLDYRAYIGLEPLEVPIPRNYACLVGAVAEDLPLKDGSVDAALLSTSLDHIEDVDKAIAELKRILAPGGRMYIWSAVHEPEILAREKTFHNILYHGSLLKKAARIAAAHVEYGWLLWRMAKRRRDLEKGVPLDHAHCRYYTRDSLKRSIAGWGMTVERFILVPGSNSVFAEARPA